MSHSLITRRTSSAWEIIRGSNIAPPVERNAIAGFTGTNRIEWQHIDFANLVKPYLLSIWGFWASLPYSFAVPYALGQTGGIVDNKENIQLSGAGIIQAASRTITGQAASNGTFPIQSWNHIGAAFISNSLRIIYMNGGNKISNTNLLTVPPFAGSFIGRITSSIWLGALASPSIWDLTDLSEIEYDQLVLLLSQGANPIDLDSGVGIYNDRIYVINSIKAFSPLDGLDNIAPWTIVGTGLTEFDSYPPIDN